MKKNMTIWPLTALTQTLTLNLTPTLILNLSLIPTLTLALTKTQAQLYPKINPKHTLNLNLTLFMGI